MSSRTTIKDVASAAGVSTATVSRFLNDSGYVNDSTSQRIQEAIQITGFTPSLMARGLKTRRTRMLLLVVPDICNPFYSRMAQILQELAQQSGYFILLSDSKGDYAKEIAALDIATQMSVEGVLFATINRNPEATRILAEGRYSVVGVNAFEPGAPFDVVVTHNRGGTNLAVEYLTGLGHRDVAFAGGTPQSIIADSRKNGYLHAMGKMGLEVTERSIIEIGFSQEDGYRAGRQFAAMRPLPTAICCANDLIALGVIHALNDAGLRVPEDVSITGMDDIPYAQISNPRLTTVSNDSALFAREVFRMLLERIRGKEKGAPRRVEIPNELLVRDSVCAPRE